MSSVQEIALIAGLIGAMCGWVMGRVGSWFGNRKSRSREEDLNHRVRALEADLRVAQRNAEEAAAQSEQHRQELETLRLQVKNESSAIRERDEQLRKLRQSLADECNKTQSLRQELTMRAEETLRAKVRAKEAETELGVARAGSDAVAAQVKRLVAEREELARRLEALQPEAPAARAKPTASVTRLPVREIVKEG
jgi:chromosome segregation ATPase